MGNPAQGSPRKKRNNGQMKTLIVALTLLLYTTSLWAQTPSPFKVTPIPPGPDVITPLHKGQPAPHDGALFDLDTAKRWGGYLTQYDNAIEREREYRQELVALETRQLRELHALQMEAKNRELLLALQRVTELEKKATAPSFYQSPWFGALVGASVTALLLGGVVLILSPRTSR